MMAEPVSQGLKTWKFEAFDKIHKFCVYNQKQEQWSEVRPVDLQ